MSTEPKNLSREDTDALADELAKYLTENNNLGVGHLAEKTGHDQEIVTQILDEYRVDENGQPHWAGPGQGGGWVPQPEMEAPDGEE